MTLRTWLILVGITGAVIAGYTLHVRSQGRLEGEIAARGESIRQLGALAARKHVVYLKAKQAYTLKPSLETCRPALDNCVQLHEADSSQIVLLNQQIEDYKKLGKQRKLFGFLPRPTVIVGGCIDQRLKPGLCIAGGFPLTH